MSTPKSWAVELRRCLYSLGIALTVGLIIGEVLLCLLLGALGLLVFHLVQLYRVDQWMTGSSRAPLMDLSGPLAAIHAQLIKVKRQNRKRKKRLRRAAEEVRDAAGAMPDATVLLGPRDEIVWCNQAADEWLGLRDKLDRAQPIANMLRAPEFVEYLEGRDFTEPLEMNSPVDEDLRLLIRVVEYGKNRHLLQARNITRLHRLEQMRKDFVANVSHELRSPLTVIVGYLETLADDPKAPEKWQRPVAQMNQQAARMVSIVEDLLRLSRLENDPNGAPRVAIDVLDLLQSVARDARSLSGDKHHIEVIAACQDSLLGDYNELYSAFANVAFNAVSYTPEGGRIELRWERRTDSEWVVRVTDTGIGIDDVHIPRLTERFYRVDKARSRELGGTGLGLAIVKHVLARHGGRLEVSSVLGEGSAFSCVFRSPRIAVRDDSRKVSAAAEAPSSDTDGAGASSEGQALSGPA